MRVFRFITITTFNLALAVGAIGQKTPAAPQLDCNKEADPFASYCSNINNFLALAAAHKDSKTGKIDRTNQDVRSALASFAPLPITNNHFISLVASSVALRNALATTLAAVNQNRPDKETSAGSQANGTTDLVEKPGIASVLAFALESGALTREINGNTATLSGNLDGVVRLVTGQQVLCFDCPHAMGSPVLRDIGVTAAFLINQQNTTSVPTNGAANPSTPSTITSVNIPSTVGKLSQINARYQIWNPYDPRSPQFMAAWVKAVNATQADIDAATQDLQQKLQPLAVKSPINADAQYKSKLDSFKETFYQDAETSNLSKLRQDFTNFFDLTVNTLRKDDPEFDNNMALAAISLAQYRNLWNKILNTAKGQPLLTLEYTFSKPQSEPETHDFRIIYGHATNGGLGLLSVNGAVSFYGNTIPAGAKYGRLHDGQVSAEYDRPVTLMNKPNMGTFSLAAYWQYQPDPTVLNITPGNLAPGTNIQLPGDAQVLLGTAGSIYVTQAKFTINGSKGIKVPVAVKWSNKTDLLNKNKTGAQVGISYDFSSLSSFFGGGQ